MKDATEDLVVQIDKVITAMEKDLESKKVAQSCCNPDDSVSLQILPLSETDKRCQSSQLVLSRLVDMDSYETLNISDLLPEDRKKRYLWMTEIKTKGLSHKHRLALYTRTFGSNMESVHFMWKCSPEVMEHEDNQLRITREIDKDLPRYHSEVVKRSFAKVAEKLAIKPMKARILYKIATNDASASRSADKAIDNRIEQFCQLEDSDIVLDLRQLNHRPAKFDEFFNAAAAIIEGQVDLAVDDRRHDRVVHLGKAMSAADLYK